MSNADDIRRIMITTNAPAADLEAVGEGPTWTTTEMQQDFEPLGFAAPFIVVRRRSDGVRGSLEFVHGPVRIYFNWEPES